MSTTTLLIGAFGLGAFVGILGLLLLFSLPQMKKFIKTLFGGAKRRNQINEIREWLAQADQRGIDEVSASLTLVNKHNFNPDIVKEALNKYKKEKEKYGTQQKGNQQVSANAYPGANPGIPTEPIGSGDLGSYSGSGQLDRGTRDLDLERSGNRVPTDLGEIGHGNNGNEKPKRYFE